MKISDLANTLIRSRPLDVAVSFTLVALLSLCFAYFLEEAFGLTPCKLCLWQRIPYAVALAGAVTIPLGLIRFTLFYQTFAYAVGFALALYHSGGERGVWSLQACTGLFRPSEMSITELSAKLSATPSVQCDQLRETLFGFSLSNYNLLFSALLTLVGLRAIYLCTKKTDPI